MSWWRYEKDASGRTIYTSTDVSALIMFIPFFFLFPGMLYFVDPTGTVRSFLWSGLACILAAKLSLFRRRIWTSWGTGEMTVGWARLYKFGYGLIGLAIILIIITFRAARP
jgi:hypothetical protein